MKKSLILVGMLSIGYAYAQEGNVGINTENPKATLEVLPNSANLTKTTNEGIIAPKLTKARIAGIADANLVEGTLVYATDNTYTGANTKVSKITEKGYYFYNGAEWVKVQHQNSSSTEPWYNAENNLPATANTERIYQMNKVGIGQKNPQYGLDIKGEDFYNSSIRISRNQENPLSSSVVLSKSRGTTDAPTTVKENDSMGGLSFFGYNNGVYKSAAAIVSVVDGPVIDTDLLPGAIQFRTFSKGRNYENHKFDSPTTRMTISSDGYVGIGTLKPEMALQVVGESYNRSSINASRISNNGLPPGFLFIKGKGTMENPTSVEDGDYLGAISYAGYNGSEIQTAAAIVGKVGGEVVNGEAIPGELQFRVFGKGDTYKNILDYSYFTKMVIASSGNVGIGINTPSNKLHIKADANPLKLEGVQTGTGEALVIDANGVVKKGTVAATEASKVASANALQCNAENRGKMNFVPNDNGSDVFGICLRNKDGNYYWGYMVGGNNPTNGTGAFGSGL